MAPHIHANDDETRHQPDDAIAILTADHCQVRALFQQYAEALVGFQGLTHHGQDVRT